MYVFSTSYMTNIRSLAITMCYLMYWRPADMAAPSPAMAAAPGQGLVRTAPALSELKTNPTRKVAVSCWPILWGCQCITLSLTWYMMIFDFYIFTVMKLSNNACFKNLVKTALSEKESALIWHEHFENKTVATCHVSTIGFTISRLQSSWYDWVKCGVSPT